jgi:hypothetical protein
MIYRHPQGRRIPDAAWALPAPIPAHLMRTRRLVRDFERRTTSAEAMVYRSTILLMTRRLARSRSVSA